MALGFYVINGGAFFALEVIATMTLCFFLRSELSLGEELDAGFGKGGKDFLQEKVVERVFFDKEILRKLC